MHINSEVDLDRGVATRVENLARDDAWAVTFMPMPMPKTVCRTNVWNKIYKIVQHEICIILAGRGMGVNITARCR